MLRPHFELEYLNLRKNIFGTKFETYILLGQQDPQMITSSTNGKLVIVLLCVYCPVQQFTHFFQSYYKNLPYTDASQICISSLVLSLQLQIFFFSCCNLGIVSYMKCNMYRRELLIFYMFPHPQPWGIFCLWLYLYIYPNSYLFSPCTSHFIFCLGYCYCLLSDPSAAVILKHVLSTAAIGRGQIIGRIVIC